MRVTRSLSEKARPGEKFSGNDTGSFKNGEVAQLELPNKTAESDCSLDFMDYLLSGSDCSMKSTLRPEVTRAKGPSVLQNSGKRNHSHPNLKTSSTASSLCTKEKQVYYLYIRFYSCTVGILTLWADAA